MNDAARIAVVTPQRHDDLAAANASVKLAAKGLDSGPVFAIEGDDEA